MVYTICTVCSNVDSFLKKEIGISLSLFIAYVLSHCIAAP